MYSGENNSVVCIGCARYDACRKGSDNRIDRYANREELSTALYDA